MTLTPALSAGLGFIGVTTPDFIDAQPMQFADQEAHAAAMERAEREVDETVRQWKAMKFYARTSQI